MYVLNHQFEGVSKPSIVSNKAVVVESIKQAEPVKCPEPKVIEKIVEVPV